MLPSGIRKIRNPYQLWYEFLKRSEKYKKFCEDMRASQDQDSTAENAKLLDTYFSWGDVYVNPFHKSYGEFKRNCIPITREAVVDYKVEFRKRATDIIINYKKYYGKKISFPIFISRIERDFKRQTIVLKIDPTGGMNSEILAKVEEALEEKRRQSSTKALVRIECINNHLTTDTPNIEYLKNSLIVYDLQKSGMKYRAIAAALDLPKWGDVERNLKRHKAAAIKLITGAEQGIFPGDYQCPEEPYRYGVL
jgi:hypothetical protein